MNNVKSQMMNEYFEIKIITLLLQLFFYVVESSLLSLVCSNIIKNTVAKKYNIANLYRFIISKELP